MKLSIIAPFYNEEKNIHLVLEEYLKFKGQYDFEFIAVNNGSTDRSAEVFSKFQRDTLYPFLRVVTVAKNIGYGHGIMTGIRIASGEIITWTHADLQTDTADVFRAFDEWQKYLDKKTVVKGYRINRPFAQVFLSYGMATVASLALGKLFVEINAQPKLFHRSFLKYMPVPPEDFSFDLYFLYQAKKHGYKIRDIKVYFKKRLYGKSKWAYSFASRWRTIMRTLKYIVKLRRSLS